MAKKKKNSPLKKMTLQEAVVSIKAKFGKNAIMSAADMPEVRFLSLGIPELDFSLGGGYPYGRIIHVYGRKNSGKTFMAMKAAANFLKENPAKKVAWADLENVFDRRRAKAIGVDLSRIHLVRAASAEGVYDILLDLVRTGEYGMSVVDSVAAVLPMVESEASMDEAQMGVAPRVMNKFLRKWGGEVANFIYDECPPILILNNQRREKLGTYVPTETSPGGRGIGFFASIEINIAKGDDVTLKEEDDNGEPIIIGHDTKFHVEKNNVFPRGKKGKFILCTRPYEVGGYRISANEVDWPVGLLHYADYYGVVEKRGSHYYFRGEKMGKSRVEAQSCLFNDGQLSCEIYKETLNGVLKKHGHEETKVDTAGKANRQKNIRKKNTWKRKQTTVSG